jgi:hypothetical protein
VSASRETATKQGDVCKCQKKREDSANENMPIRKRIRMLKFELTTGASRILCLGPRSSLRKQEEQEMCQSGA